VARLDVNRRQSPAEGVLPALRLLRECMAAYEDAEASEPRGDDGEEVASPCLVQVVANEVAQRCPPHAADQTAKIEVDGRATTWSSRAPTPEKPPADAMPADDGLGLHHDDGVEQTAETASEGTSPLHSPWPGSSS